jgi:hypothetical protein
MVNFNILNISLTLEFRLHTMCDHTFRVILDKDPGIKARRTNWKQIECWIGHFFTLKKTLFLKVQWVCIKALYTLIVCNSWVEVQDITQKNFLVFFFGMGINLNISCKFKSFSTCENWCFNFSLFVSSFIFMHLKKLRMHSF